MNLNYHISRVIADYVTRISVKRKVPSFMPFEEIEPGRIPESYNLINYLMMTGDRIRMNAYRKAIERSVEGGTVLEIGTGALAPLARMCAQAGAEKVYAVEANPEACEFAANLIKRKGLDDRIEIIQGFSSKVSLPEKADILVHELIGELGSNEGMVGFVEDAKERLLKEGAFIIPSGNSVLGALATGPKFDNPLSIRLVNLVKGIRNGCRLNRKVHAFWNFPRENLIGKAEEYERIRFDDESRLVEYRELEFEIKKKALFNGYAFWNRIDFGGGNELDCFSGTHWPVVYIETIDRGIEVPAGDTVRLKSYRNLESFPYYSFKTRIENHTGTVKLDTVDICCGH